VYAHSITIAARPESIDAGVAHVRDEVMPALERRDGYVGLSLLVGRETGRCIATTAWKTEAAMRAGTDGLGPLRDAPLAFSAVRDPTFDEWEIAVLYRDHRAGRDACVRTTWLKAHPGQFHRAVEFYRESVLPLMEDLEGFCSASLMVDHVSGRAVSSASFDSVAAMERNRDHARVMRTARLRGLGAEQLDVGEFELALAHLRVPELA